MEPLFKGLVQNKIKFFENKIQSNLPKIKYELELRILDQEIDKITLLNNLLKKIPIPDNSFCICQNCQAVFQSDLSLFNHNCPNNIIDQDTIPVEYNGLICPGCGKKYLNEYLLGEHFSQTHNNYENLISLDNNIIHTGFPGWDLLFKINMIQKYPPDKFTCKICYLETNKKIIKLTCCQNKICKSCLKSHISISDSVICPFCSFDHTKINQDYVIYIEPSDITDRSKWLTWWENHMDIFI